MGQRLGLVALDYGMHAFILNSILILFFHFHYCTSIMQRNVFYSVFLNREIKVIIDLRSLHLI
jgi:hypothetical protein